MGKVIGIDMGHSISGAGTGACGILSETGKNREIGNRLIEMLIEKGHTAINCSVDSASSVGNQLAGIVGKANAQSLDLFVSIHLNAGGGHGTEIYTYPNCEDADTAAKAILTEVVASCGFRNRGLKNADFYVLRETSANAVLLEVCFVDSQEDANKLDTEAVARAIFKGVTGTEYVSPTPAPSPSGTLFRVVCGTYADRSNAEAQQGKLKNAGFDSFLVAYQK